MFRYACLFVALLSLFPPSLLAAEELSRTFEVSPGGLLQVAAERGAIEVKTSAVNTATVEIIPKDLAQFRENYEYSIAQAGNSIIVRISSKSRLASWFGWNLRTFRIIASIPKEFNVDLETSGGSIFVEDLTGSADARTSGGSIALGRIHGPVNAETSGGTVSVESASGTSVLQTSGGSISMGEVNGEVEAGTSGGSISIEGANARIEAETSGGSIRASNLRGTLDASTSGGSIDVEFASRPDGDCHLGTSGGGIRLAVPQGTGFQLEASTSGGRVVTRLSTGVQGHVEKDYIRGTVGGGGPRLRLQTTGGNITVEEH